MQKWKFILAVGIMTFACAGCGTQKIENVAPTEDVPVAEAETEMENELSESEVEEMNDNYADLEEKGAEARLLKPKRILWSWEPMSFLRKKDAR